MKGKTEEISAKGAWKVRRECGYDQISLNLDDFKDIVAKFFYSSRFKSSDAFDIKSPSDVLIQLPSVNVAWKSKGGFFSSPIGKETNRGFITNSSNYKKIATVGKKDKKEREEFWERWFSCFFHPAIYLEFERLVLHTEFKKRYSEENENSDSKEDDEINKTTKKLFESFCKMRTKFIKCYSDTVKPAFFCEGLFSQLPKENREREEVMELIRTLGHSSVDQELEDFVGNKNIDPSSRASKDRKKRFNEKPQKEKSLEEEIEETKRKLMQLNKQKENSEDIDSLERELDSEFGTKFGKALHSTASVITMWKKAKSRKDVDNVVKLFKMYEAVSFKKPKERKVFHKLMIRSRRLF